MNILQRMMGALGVRSAYSAGRQPASKAPWTPRTGSAKRAQEGAHPRVADRARDAVRNNAYAARIVDLWTANAVGAGITTRWADDACATAWLRWAGNTGCDAERRSDWAGIQVLAMRATVESGEVLIRRRVVRPTPQNPVGLELVVMEADVLDASRTGMHAGNRVVQGVEVDAVGAPVAYWLRHDAEAWPYGPVSQRAERVPAEEMIHMFRRRRPGQVRDVSWLAPVLWSLRDLGTYEAALLRKAEIEACLTLVVNEEGEETVTGGGDADDAAGRMRDGRGRVVEDVQPGLILYRRGGGSVEVVNPSSGGSHVGFARRTLESAAVGSGLTYDQVSGDLTNANYSSLRAGKIEFRALLEQVQYAMLIPVMVDRVAEWFHAQGMMLGLWDDAAHARAHRPPAPEMVDPLKDTAAMIAQVRAGFISQQDAVASFGYDFGQVAKAIREANAVLDDAGIVLDTDPRRLAKAGSAHDPAQVAAVEIAATGAASPQQPAP